MNLKIKNSLPIIFLILLVLVIIPQTFATDSVATNDNIQDVINDVEDITINETNHDNTQLSENDEIKQNTETNYWRMAMNPTTITYNDDGCTVDVTIETDMVSAGELVYWINGTATTYPVYIGSGYSKAYTNTASFQIDLSHLGTSNLFDTDGVYEVSLRPSNGASYMGYTFNDITPEFGTVIVTVGSGGSSSVTAYTTTPTVNSQNSVAYTKGTQTIVNVAVDYPESMEEDLEWAQKVFVYIDTISTTTRVEISGVTSTQKSFTYDLENIKDNLTVGSHTLYFGPNSGSLDDTDYKPLSVTVSEASSSENMYTSTPKVNGETSVAYTKGTSTIVTVTVDYPDALADELEEEEIKVYINPTEVTSTSITVSNENKITLSSVDPKSKSFTFDLEDIKDKLSTTETNMIYVGPSPASLTYYAFDGVVYNPLTVTVSEGGSGSSKTPTNLTIDNTGTTVYTGTDITGKLTDNTGIGLVGKTISYKIGSTEKTVTTTTGGVFNISTSTTGTYYNFKFEGDTSYEASSSAKSFTVKEQPKFELNITETTIVYTPGTETIINGKMSFPTNIYFSTANNGNRLFVWYNNDISTAELASDDYGYLTLSNGDFEVDLSKLEFDFKPGKNYTLTFGPKNGVDNADLAYYGANIVLDSINVTIPGTVKKDTNIILDNSVVVEGSTINGKLIDEDNKTLKSKTISVSLKLPSGSTESSNVTTGNDGTFKITDAKVGVYTFTFAEDSNYAKATNTTTVTYANKKVVVTVTEDSITYKKGENTIIHGTISGVASYMFYSGDTELYVWVNGDLSTQEIVYDEDGYKVDMSNGAFTANLKLMDFEFEVGETYTLTFGPKDGANNEILINLYYLYSADLDNVTVKVTDKDTSKITLDATSIKATQDITGKLTDNSDNGIASATIKFVKPDGTSDTVTTGSDGTFTISSAVEGTYSNFEFEGDTTYEGVVASSNVTVSGPKATTLTVNKIDDTVFVGKTITGMLTDSEDTGIADAVIKYTGPNGADTVTTDSTGAFTISNVELGEYKDFSFEATIDYQAASVNGAVTVISTPTYNGIIYVSKSGSDSNDGSESSPVATIAKAIELAEYTLDHKIIVSAGTYREHDLSINDALSITGVGNVIIDANKQGKIFNIDTAEEVSLTNLTLINGKSTTDGGAISIKDAKVIIDGLTFRNNMVAKDDGTLAGYGGAISWNADEGLLINSVFINNSARTSGAVNWGDMYSSGATGGDIINCTFDSNYATSKTGALSLYIPANVINSTFKNNNASDPSGIATQVGALYVYASNSLITGSEFINNYALGYGGAIEIDIASDGTVINDTKFINNTGNSGGAIEAQGSNIVIGNSTFISNHATYDGGAIDLLLSMDSDEGVFINNNIFESNVADNDGGAISIDGSESYGYDNGVFLEDNTFTSNTARHGGAISTDSDSVLNLKNNEFTSNVASVSGGAIKDGKLTLEGNTANDNEAPVGACIYLETGSIESDVTLTYSSISALSGDTVTLTAILTDDNGNSIVLYGNSYYPGVYFTVEGNDVLGTVTYNSENMTIEYEVTQSTGDYTISGSVDSDFADSVTVVDGTLSVVEELETVLTVENQTINYGTSFTGTLTDINGKPLAGKEITYTYKGNTLTVTTDDEGVFTISSAREGIYSDFAFAGDDSYTESTSDAVVTVREQVIPTPTIVNVTITDSSLTVNNGTVSVHVSPSDDSIVNSGSVSLTVDGVTYSSNVTNGVATFNLNLISGNYSALVDYIAIGNYTNASKNLTVIVPTTNNTNDTNHTNVTTNVSTIITLEFEELETGHEIRGKLTDANGNLLNGNVDIALSRLSSGASKTYTVTCTNGEFVLPLHLAPGDYSAKATYNGEGNYLPNSTGVKYIALTDKPSNVILNDSDEVTGVYGENNTFGGVLTDKEGNALAGYHLALNITRLSSGASKIYYVTTDYNGNYVLPINLAPGYYTIRTVVDDKNYTGTGLSSLIIRSNDSDIDSRNETVLNVVSTVIDSSTGGNLSGKLLNTLGYGIAGQYVDVTLANTNGASKTYSLVTDYTGSFNLPINLGKGSYTAVCAYDGTSTYAPSKTGTLALTVI